MVSGRSIMTTAWKGPQSGGPATSYHATSAYASLGRFFHQNLLTLAAKRPMIPLSRRDGHSQIQEVSRCGKSLRACLGSGKWIVAALAGPGRLGGIARLRHRGTAAKEQQASGDIT